MLSVTATALALLAGFILGWAARHLLRRWRGWAIAEALSIDDAPVPMLMVDHNGYIVGANALLEQLFGYGPGQLRRQPLERLVPVVSRQVHARLRRDYSAEPVPRPMSKRDLYGLHKDGHLIPVEVGLSVASHRNRIATLATVTDISDKKRYEHELVTANALMSAMIGSMPFSVIATDTNGTISAMSPAAERMLGYRSDELVGRCTPDIIHDPSEVSERARELSEELRRPVAAGFEVFVAKPRQGPPESRLWTYIRKDRSRLPVQLTVSAIHNPEQQIVGFLGIAYDATEQQRKDERLSQLAYYDLLTGLPNRALLEDRFAQALERAKRAGHRVALMLVDLDHFKQVNDSLGHAAGDQLLIAIGARLQHCIRASDTVARLGGDEFVVVLSDIQNPDLIQTVATQILAAIFRPVPYSNQLLRVTPSIGISLFPDLGEDMETLLRQADCAMYAVKSEGRAAAQIYTENITWRPLSGTDGGAA